MGGKINNTAYYLNELLRTDPETMNKLMFHRVECKEELNIPALYNESGPFTSPLGLLNGVLIANKMPTVIMHYENIEDVNKIKEFSDNI